MYFAPDSMLVNLKLCVRDDSEGKRVKRVCEFWDERYGKNRSITDVDWSPKVCHASSSFCTSYKYILFVLVP